MNWRNMFVDPPNPNAGFTETVAFNIWAHRKSALDILINELAFSNNPNDDNVQDRAFAKAGFLSIDDLTEAEIDFVQKEASKKWQKIHKVEGF